jgi:tetratricopeptide (TPR) repeat protein
MPKQVKQTLVISIYLALTVSALLVFWQVRIFDFVNYDDIDYVYENPHVLNGLTTDGVWWAFTTGYSTNWHPLTWLSLMLDCQLFGANAGRMHLVNLLLHLANTLLLFTVLKKMTGALWQSAFVAALFALHPLHVESVAWIAERKDVLSTFFLLLTLAAYIGYANRPSIFRYAVTLAVFAFGLMTKPMLVTLPFVLLLLDYWPLNRLMPQTVALSGRQNRKSASAANNPPTLYRIIIEKVPFFVLSVISSVITFLVQRSSGAVSDIDALSLNNRIANIFLSYAQYIGKMFWPQNLAAFYPFNVGSIPFWQAAACALLLLGISFFVVRFGRSQRYLLTGWFWFVGTLVPVIGIVQVGRQSYADRYTYVPYIGLFIMLAWGLPQLLSKWAQRKIALGLSMVIILTALGICAHRQVSYWKNSITLFSHVNEVTQNNFTACNNLGAAYNSIGRYAEAIKSYNQAIILNPNYVIAQNNISNVYVKLGRYTEAIEVYKNAIRIRPDYAEAYFGLGLTYYKLGRGAEAIEAYKQAIRIKPDYADAHNNLGIAYGNLDRDTEAIEAYKNAIRIRPNYAEAHFALGFAYYKLGRYQESIEACKQAIRIKPDYADAYNNLGVSYGNLGRWPEAIEAYKNVVRIKPDYTDAHVNLANAYLAIGDKNSAMAEYNILRSLNSETANKLLNQIKK